MIFSPPIKYHLMTDTYKISFMYMLMKMNNLF